MLLIGLMLGILGFQIWEAERHSARQKADFDRQMADLARQNAERAQQTAEHARQMAEHARQMADWRLRQAKANADLQLYG